MDLAVPHGFTKKSKFLCWLYHWQLCYSTITLVNTYWIIIIIKLVVSELKYCQWISVKNPAAKMPSLDVCCSKHLLALPVPRAGPVCGFTLLQHPVLQQSVVQVTLGKWWYRFTFYGWNCVFTRPVQEVSDVTFFPRKLMKHGRWRGPSCTYVDFFPPAGSLSHVQPACEWECIRSERRIVIFC
jgi:hypothetical protein